MNILWTSKRIHHETKLVYFQINEFHIGIERDYRRPRENCSISGLLGYNIVVGDNTRAKSYWQQVPYGMIPYMRKIHLCVGGSGEGVCEADLVPPRIRDIHGPERPTYILVQSLMEKICEILDSSDALQTFRLSIRSRDKLPGSIGNLLVPISKLRGIPTTRLGCSSMRTDMWIDWIMKASYGRYLSRLLALPRGAPPLKYVGDENDTDQSEDNIFDIISNYCLQHRGFIDPHEVETEALDDIDATNSNGVNFDDMDEHTFFNNVGEWPGTYVDMSQRPPGWESSGDEMDE